MTNDNISISIVYSTPKFKIDIWHRTTYLLL